MPGLYTGIADAADNRASIVGGALSVVTTAGSGVATYNGADPTWTGVYVHALVDSPGVVAATRYLSVFNPVGSGKIAIALGFTVSSYSTGSVTGVTSMFASRHSTASGGTTIAANAVQRFVTSMPDPVSVVRVNNPTVTTTGTPLLGLVPVIGGVAGVGAVVIPPPGPGFAFLPGDGVVFQVTTGDTQQRWNLQYIWAEKPV